MLRKLGLEGCFESIICFESLNPIHKCIASDDEDDIAFLGSKTHSAAPKRGEIFDIAAHFSRPNAGASGLPKTPIVCKPLESAIETALEIAKIDPRRTVSLLLWFINSLLQTLILHSDTHIYIYMYMLIVCVHLQLFFEDSVRNIQSGKRVGLDTVLVRSNINIVGIEDKVDRFSSKLD